MEFKITSAKHYEETMIAIFELQEQEEPPLTKQQLVGCNHGIVA